MNSSRQHAFEMRHQLNVITIVAAELVQAQAGGAEILFEDRQAARRRVAPHIDDLRPRQDQMNHAEVMVIARVLVDKMSAFEPAVYTSVLQILFSQKAEHRRLPIARERRDSLPRAVGTRVPQAAARGPECI